MSNQPENEQTEIVTSEEVRQYVLAEIDATKQVIAELSDEELEEVAGGVLGYSLPGSGLVNGVINRVANYGPGLVAVAQGIQGFKAQRANSKMMRQMQQTPRP
jgi:hypothetical protein